ncbi:MAG: ferritin family protein [candidate division WOR-3 bacterium]|nr:ferritin family protein [candidate division WOR-3 bacterium]MCX7756992.1 ferritin family protein [candidate division WOR-3 bacterium]MDW7988404.1 ferritin family protein [candidate division WOR-3 bacterium]
MIEYDPKKALEIAINAEKTGLKTYLEFAYKTKDESGKNMFIRLALDEFEHMTILETQKESVQEKECWIPIKVEISEIEKIIPKIKEKTVRIQGTEGLDQMSALRTALDLEDRAIKFYKEQAEKSVDEKAREMFMRLCEMEKAHYELIRAEIDYIEKTGFWFNLQEFSLELE